MNNRLAVSGGIGAGKTMLVERLVREHNFKATSFSWMITTELAAALGRDYSPARLAEAKSVPEVRQLIQAWGNFRRRQDENYWPNAVLHHLFGPSGIVTDTNYAPHNDVIVDSVRTANEVVTLRRSGFSHIRLATPGERKFEYLTKIQGMSIEEASDVMANVSEHLLDGNDRMADLLIEVPHPAGSQAADDFVYRAVCGRFNLSMLPGCGSCGVVEGNHLPECRYLHL